MGIEANPRKRPGCRAISSAYASLTIRATSGCVFSSAKKTLGVESETTSTSMPTRSMSARRRPGSVIGGWMPKKRAPRYLMMVRPVGSLSKVNSDGVSRIFWK